MSTAGQVTDYNADIDPPLKADASPEERADWFRLWGSIVASRRAQGVPNMEAFVRATKPDYDVQWFHRQIMRRLDRLLATPNDRLMLFMPPGFGKSELVSRRLPAYALGLNPDWWVLSWSHTHDLAKEMGLDVQRVMEGDEYRQLFPDSRIPTPGERTEGKKRRTDVYFEMVGRTGKYKAAGVGGGIAGRRFNLGIIDDPIRSVEDALSATMRAKVVREFSGAFATRQFPGARILITTTRYHNQDLCGWLIDLANKGGERYDILSFPAIR